ncbi:hypothetical protein AMJ80_12545 [bacterium SM23_31]|nr:MAG: hypothetical protein AMJ80_12545 [bacterium SM23_31]
MYSPERMRYWNLPDISIHILKNTFFYFKLQASISLFFSIVKSKAEPGDIILAGRAVHFPGE